MTLSSSPDALCLVGAGGHARAAIALLHSAGFAVAGIYDDSYRPENNEFILSIPLLGTLDTIPPRSRLLLAVGNNRRRAELYERFQQQVFPDSILHRSASVEEHTELGPANQILARVYINAGARIGANNLLNTACIIEHECVIGNHNHIAPGAVLTGRVHIGNNCFIGAQAVVRDGVHIADDITVGAGAVVISELREPGTYVGNPVRKIP